MNIVAATTKERPEELRIFVERLLHFMNLWTIYKDMNTSKYVPSVGKVANTSWDAVDGEEWPVNITMMFVLYAYFYSLVEDCDDGLNGFRVWREVWPQEGEAISAVEARVRPFVGRLRVFRNRLGFHGSRTRQHEGKGFDLFNEHSGAEVYESMRLFKSLGSALLGMDTAVYSNNLEDQARWRAWIDKVTAQAQMKPCPTSA